MMSHHLSNMDLLFHLIDYPKDEYVVNSTGYYAPIFLESLLIHLQPLVEKTVSKKLYPSYSYGRIYYNKSILEKHKDRPPSEYGVSLCISKDIDWTIYFEENGKAVPYNLNETDIIVYKGYLTGFLNVKKFFIYKIGYRFFFNVGINSDI